MLVKGIALCARPDLPYGFLGFSPGPRGFKGPPAKSNQSKIDDMRKNRRAACNPPLILESVLQLRIPIQRIEKSRRLTDIEHLIKFFVHGFAHTNIECAPLSFILNDFPVNPNFVSTFNSGPGTILDFNHRHTFDFNTGPTLGFDLGFALNFNTGIEFSRDGEFLLPITLTIVGYTSDYPPSSLGVNLN
ncbi:hypothetical protein EVAR_29834_1 [Eumeta japonica]|uniref:Uncharacterized protein n=1 Tax=Eumeta variegata TaxID=151549 RepID=A0A4C1VWM5_EUMVA|nr:hypothetical protein EVAR_29834_1 [Eumeta japonica]